MGRKLRDKFLALAKETDPDRLPGAEDVAEIQGATKLESVLLLFLFFSSLYFRFSLK